MKRLFLVVLILLSLDGMAQSLLEFEQSSSRPEGSLDDRITRLVQDNSAVEVNSIRGLRHLFEETHAKFLHHYSPLAEFNDLKDRTYDCLTATALFSYLLESRGVPFKVMETSYHIFIIAQTKEGEVLLETTDRWNGFVTDASDIQERITSYRNYAPEAGTDALLYRYNTQVYREVPLDELTGLLYYNRAVKAFNQHHWTECRSLLIEARKRCDTPRIGEMFDLLQVVASL